MAEDEVKPIKAPQGPLHDFQATHWPPEAGRYGLGENEREWAQMQPYLESRGYMLRPRYRPGWEKTWPREEFSRGGFRREDEWPAMIAPGRLIDATRISDGKLVVLKRSEAGSQEPNFTKKFSTPEMAKDSRNHCIPLLDVIDIPGENGSHLLVLPLLRRYTVEPFETVGSCLDFVRQTLEGIAFMHERRVAHADCGDMNFLQDGTTVPGGYHPQMHFAVPDGNGSVKPLSRTAVGGVRYTIIDFGISVDLDAPDTHRTGAYGQIWSPEMKMHPERRHDPAKVDVWVLGEVYDQILLQELVKYMKTEQPQERPSIAQAFERFQEGMKSWVIRNVTSHLRAKKRGEFFVASIFRDIFHIPGHILDTRKGLKARKQVSEAPTAESAPL